MSVLPEKLNVYRSGNWYRVAYDAIDNFSLFEGGMKYVPGGLSGMNTLIHKFNRWNFNDKLIDLYSDDAVYKVVDLMRDIYSNNKYGNINEVLTQKSLAFKSNQLYKSIDHIYKEKTVTLTLINPNYYGGPDYGDFYQVNYRGFGKFGRVSWGTIDIAGRYSILSLKISNEILYNETYEHIFKQR